MKNKNSLQLGIKIICAIAYCLEFVVLVYLNYFYLQKYMGCTMTPIPFLADICQSGASVLFLLTCLDVFLCYKTLFSEKSKIWYAPLLVFFLGSQIILILSISAANI